MGALINDLLEYSRIGRADKNMSRVDTNEVAAAVQKNLEEKIKEHGASIVYENLPTLYSSCTYLIQLFQNLIGNAIKFQGEELPVVRVEARKQQKF